MPAKTGFVNGTDLGIYIDGTLISFSTNSSIQRAMDTREVTNKSSAGNKEYREAALGWTASGEHIFAPDAANGYYELETAMLTRATVTVRVSMNTVGNYYWEGEAYITALDASAPVEGNITYTVSLQGTAALAKTMQT